MHKRLFFLLVFVLFFSSNVLALEKYSYEKAEALTPLIEWRDYGPEAFQEAVDENKPIFLLLTAPSWCYWCQVYESEDYLFHPELYPYLNEHTIPVYVDADKRQDLTRQYLEGGWPSTSVFTPSREKLFGFSGPRPPENILQNLQNAASYISSKEHTLEYTYEYQESTIYPFVEGNLQHALNSYIEFNVASYDEEYGGFGRGQKFPQGRSLDYFLVQYEKTGNEAYLAIVEHTLENHYTSLDELATNYNLYDPVEGGFHRYGTTREWSPPHYEKMLYDNARLLKAYYYLTVLSPENTLAKEVVQGTLAFIEGQWYDSVQGGFFGNSDVHGEDAYYAKNPRPVPGPRVEPTKYTPWNSEAVITYLDLFKRSGNAEYETMSKKSLDFMRKHLVGGRGAYHYSLDGQSGVTGNLLDNAYALLVFVEGYEVFGSEEYLETAEGLAQYSLDNLYDWKSAGFFERHSTETDLYAPGEHIVLTKPGEENSIIAYALLKLYEFTGDEVYLHMGIKTLGATMNSFGGLDRGYYFALSADLILERELLNEYRATSISSLEEERQASFWLDELLASQEEGTFEYSGEGAGLQGALLVLLFVSLFAGILSLISPCTLPILPAFVAYTFKSSKQNVRGLSISFFLGLTTVFVLLGVFASYLGSLLNLDTLTTVSGYLLFGFGLAVLLGMEFGGGNIKFKQKATLSSSFVFGMIMGLSWTPCVGPILASILILASSTASVSTGALLLLFYAIGFAIPLLILASYLGRIDKRGKFWKFVKGKQLKIFGFEVHSTSLISGLLFMLLGYLILAGALTSFNQYIGTSAIQGWLNGIEEWLLGLF